MASDNLKTSEHSIPAPGAANVPNGSRRREASTQPATSDHARGVCTMPPVDTPLGQRLKTGTLGRLALLLLGWLLLQPLPARAASGFPSYDPQREHIVFGRAIATASPALPQATTRGDWQQTGGRLVSTSREPGQDPLWFPSSQQANLGDGLIRVRVDLGKKPDLTLLLRIQLDRGRLDGLSGYGLAVEKETLHMYRWDRGRVLELGPAVRVKGLKNQLEIVVYLLGPQLVALAFDGTTFKHLATLTTHDTTYPKGHIGLRSGPQTDGETAVTLLSVMPLGAAPTGLVPRREHGLWLPPVPPGIAPKYGPHVPGDDTTPFGKHRYVYLHPDQAARLPTALKRHQLATVDRRTGQPEALLRLDLLDYERLRRTGIPTQAISEEVPFADINQAYREHRQSPPTPTARGFRIDESFKNAAMVEALVRGYHKRYPKISKLEVLGRSHQGRPLLGLKISKNPDRDEDEPVVLLNAAHHGSELLPVEYALDAMQRLLEDYGRDSQVTRWVDHLEIWCVPMVNPDGNHMYMEVSRYGGRKNGRDSDGNGSTDPFEGVDLNRNYPYGWGSGGERGSRSFFTHKWYRGPAPASEPETQAILKLATRYPFAAVISFHTIGTAIFSPYMVFDSEEPKPDDAVAVAREMAAAAPEQPNGHRYRTRPNGYPVSGSDQDWHRHRNGSLAYVVEGSHHNPADLEIRNRAVEATRPIWQTLLNRVLSGTGISGHTFDHTGKPIEAVVSIEEVTLRAGEVWTSRPYDGRFDRTLAGPGRYTVRAEVPGCPPVRRQVRVRDKRVNVDLTIPTQNCKRSSS